MMDESELLEMARQGNSGAIAVLLADQLRPQITVKAQLREGTLQVLLEADQVPELSAVSAIQEQLSELALPGIATVKLFARKTGELNPAWAQTVHLGEDTPDYLSQPAAVLRDLAGQADIQAINVLLNRAVAHKQIQATATLADGKLHLILRGTPIPDEQVTLTLICRELSHWQLDFAEIIKIEGWVTDSDEPGWVQEVAIAPNAEIEIPTVAQVARGQFQGLTQPQTYTERATVDDWVLEIPIKHIDREGWKAIAASLLLAVLLLSSGQVTFLLSPFLTLVHELGHAFFAWLFGFPAIPAFDFMYGGGVTMQSTERWAIVIFAIYGGFGYLFYRYWHNHLTARVLLATVIVYSICAFTALQEILVLFMGHGFELIFAGIFLYRAISGYACRYSIERPLYGMLGWFTISRDLHFAHSLIYDLDARDIYEQGKGGILDHDFVRLAGDYLGVDLSVVAWFFLVCCLLTPVLTFLLFRYEALVAYGITRLFLTTTNTPPEPYS